MLAIEDIARELLGGYDWPAAGDEREWPPSGFVDRRGFGDWHPVDPDWRPDPGKSELRYDRGSDKVCPQYDGHGRRVEGQPDFRRELLTVIQLVAELRAAAAGGHTESAILRAMTIGALFTRVATMVLNGADIASSAGARAGRDGAKAMRDDRLADSRSACEEALQHFDKCVRTKNRNLRSKSGRAGPGRSSRSMPNGRARTMKSPSVPSQSESENYEKPLSAHRSDKSLPP